MADSLAISPLTGPFVVTIDDLPGSKSLTNRALLLAGLAQGESQLTGVLRADDTDRMLTAIEALGVKLSIDDDATTVRINGCGGHWPNAGAALDLGNAGTAYRFLTAACCLGAADRAADSVANAGYTLDGIARMRQRPIKQLVDALRLIGANIDYLGDEGYPPLRVRASGLRGGAIAMPPTLSSQYISALLQVAPCCDDGLTLRFDGPVTSRPYVDMTLRLMQQFGVTATVDPAFTRITIASGSYRAANYVVEPDASNASYFLAAAALMPGSRCTIERLGFRSVQGDVWFGEVLQKMGASVIYEPTAVTVMAPPAGEGLRGIDVDLNAMPDMAQTLAVVALFARGRTVIRNVGNLRVKETDRLAALRDELGKFGAQVATEDDDLVIDPPEDLTGGGLNDDASRGGAAGAAAQVAVDTYDDHRMAMSFALAGLRRAHVTINDPGCVGKTFPQYFEYLERLRTSR